jgi:chemotaxis protein methyltransferase CheR
VSTASLDRALTATWPLSRAEEIPPHHRKEFMLRGSGASEGLMRARPDLRRLVHFVRQNLQDEQWSIGGAFDLVLCRNVLIYFTNETRGAVMDRLVSVLAPEGVLLLGHAESMRGRGDVRVAIPNVYVRCAGSSDDER